MEPASRGSRLERRRRETRRDPEGLGGTHRRWRWLWRSLETVRGSATEERFPPYHRRPPPRPPRRLSVRGEADWWGMRIRTPAPELGLLVRENARWLLIRTMAHCAKILRSIERNSILLRLAWIWQEE
ncbi:hypothetical protein KM043_014631 [Ampulex compressa]|nr:hypothetical protein KM043_014631 [Ampulex compressa]